MPEAPHAITPEDVEWAKGIAANRARKLPHMADEFESAALLGLVEASRSFDPEIGTKFRTHATGRVLGAIKDASRESEPCGYRRGWRAINPGVEAPKVESIHKTIGSRDDGTPVDLSGSIAADELPTGWEAEYQDEIEGLSRRLPTPLQPAFQAFFGRADAATMKKAGAVADISESRVSQILSKAASYLSERFPDPEEIFMAGHAAMVETNGNGTATKKCPSCGQPCSSVNGRCYVCKSGRGPGRPRNVTVENSIPTVQDSPRFVVPEPAPVVTPKTDLARSRPTKADPELAAIGAVLDALDGLGMDAKARVLTYVNARVGISV